MLPAPGLHSNNCSGCMPGSCWVAGEFAVLEMPGNPSSPGELTRTIYRVGIAGKLSPGPNPDNMSICSRGAGSPDKHPEQIPQARPRKPEQPHLTARFGGAAAPPATPHKAHQLLRWAFAIVSYWDLFGFYGIFCWCNVNHTIFSTIHKFLQLFYDLVTGEAIYVFVCYMATGNH